MQQGQAFRDSLLSELLPLRVLTKVRACWSVPAGLACCRGKGRSC